MILFSDSCEGLYAPVLAHRGQCLNVGFCLLLADQTIDILLIVLTACRSLNKIQGWESQTSNTQCQKATAATWGST